MLLIDPNEAPFLPHALLEIPNCTLPELESKTGADIVLSVWEAPVTTPALRWQHVRRGVGYQLKRGGDLISSIQDGRAMHQLARMQGWWEECWGVHVADTTYECFVDMEELHFNNRPVDFPYLSYLSHIRNWQRSGGLWLTLSPSYPFDLWIQDELNRMKRDTPTRIVRKPQTKLLPLTPQEETLATFPLLGPTRAHGLWDYLDSPDYSQTLTQALVWLSDGFAEKVEGIGKGVTKAARRHLGLKEKENLALAFDGDWPELKGGQHDQD